MNRNKLRRKYEPGRITEWKVSGNNYQTRAKELEQIIDQLVSDDS